MVLLILATVLCAIPYASLFEWTLHRFLMHKPFFGYDYPYRSHALLHHRIFKADNTYHLIDEETKHTIPMAWWNGPVLILISGTPFDVAGWYFGTWTIPFTAGVTIGLYYATYEYIHWCMHLPRKRNIERAGIFFRLNGHHLLHHRYMNRNFNVVLPLADLCLGTLLTRSKVSFKQATGPMIPDVQPIGNVTPKAPALS